MQEKEYVITLHDHKDLDSFYDDMESPGGDLFIPNRAISVVHRRLASRNTHYNLTDEEANLIRKDLRVLAVELSLEEAGLTISPSWTQSSNFWNKSNSVVNSHNNWGLLRVVEGVQRSNWGSNATSNVTGTINVTASGKHVDIVVVDGNMNPSHPEFAVNSDGTGGSRVNQYNWFLLNPAVTGGSTSTYLYTPYVDSSFTDYNFDGRSDRTTDNDHGAHVTGTFAGNTQGWARDATIYNINPYSSSPSVTGNFLDYIKVWHQTKPINPITGNKNPTITNHSYGITTNKSISSITTVRYKGNVINGPFTSNQLLNYGIYNTGGTASVSQRNTAIEQDFIDLMAAGVIVIGAAGNAYSKISLSTSTVNDDYNNYFSISGFTYYYQRGSITSAEGVITVGAINSLANDSKVTFSNCGPRIDVYAPGTSIMSSLNSNILSSSVTDTRNSTYFLNKYSGTSMASPQVAGVLACLAETWPRLSQTQALTYVQSRSKLNQITAGSGGVTDFTDLQGSPNRFLNFYKERSDTGQVGPKNNQGLRPSTGLAWPRPKIYRYGGAPSVSPTAVLLESGESLQTEDGFDIELE